MTTETIFAYASDHGLTFADGRIHGPTEHAKALGTMIRQHGLSEAVKRALRPIECLWPRSGYTSRKDFDPWPVGAFFWRHVGDTEWQAIPGRTWDAERMEGVIR